MEYIGCDSLAYISLENLRSAIGVADGFCDACLSGEYPTPLPVTLRTSASESSADARAGAPIDLQPALPGV